MPPTSKNWCFTLNNYTEDELLQVDGFLNDRCSYAIYGKEVGESGTSHLQGYFNLIERAGIQKLKSYFNSRAHLEIAKGDAGSNVRYCSKDGDFTEFGTRPSLKRTRDDVARDFRKRLDTSGNRGLIEFADDIPGTYFFTGHNLLRNYCRLRIPESRGDISVLWLFGRPGVGKSRRAHEQLPNAYIKEPRTKWWNGYLLEKDVIIDDFGPNGIDINHLLRWFDRYKCLVECKGDMIALCATTFIVTSNFHPLDCFKDKEGVPHPQMDALYRRITIEEME